MQLGFVVSLAGQWWELREAAGWMNVNKHHNEFNKNRLSELVQRPQWYKQHSQIANSILDPCSSKLSDLVQVIRLHCIPVFPTGTSGDQRKAYTLGSCVHWVHAYGAFMARLIKRSKVFLDLFREYCIAEEWHYVPSTMLLFRKGQGWLQSLYITEPNWYACDMSQDNT